MCFASGLVVPSVFHPHLWTVRRQVDNHGMTQAAQVTAEFSHDAPATGARSLANPIIFLMSSRDAITSIHPESFSQSVTKCLGRGYTYRSCALGICLNAKQWLGYRIRDSLRRPGIQLSPSSSTLALPYRISQTPANGTSMTASVPSFQHSLQSTSLSLPNTACPFPLCFR